LAMEADGCGHGHRRQASTGGGGPRGKAARAPVVPCAIEESLGSARGVPRSIGHGSRRQRASSSGGGRPQWRERPEERRVKGGGSRWRYSGTWLGRGKRGEAGRVAAMELFSADNGGHARGGVRAHEQGRRGRGRAGEGEWEARNRAWQVLWCSPHRARRRSTRRPWRTPTRAWWTRTRHAAPIEAF
jgi:hypothetical protein